MGKKTPNLKASFNALAIFVWFLVLVPFFGFFGYVKFGLTNWLSSSFPGVFEGGTMTEISLAMVPDFFQGMVAAFLALYLTLNLFKRANTFIVSGVVSFFYLVFVLFFSLAGKPLPADLAVFEVSGLFTNTLGVLLGVGIFAYKEFRIKQLVQNLEHPAS